PDAGGHQARRRREGLELARRDTAGSARHPPGDEVGGCAQCRARGALMSRSPLTLPSSSHLASDTHGIDSLRSRAATDPKAAIKEAAKQFEALFMQELM